MGERRTVVGYATKLSGYFCAKLLVRVNICMVIRANTSSLLFNKDVQFFLFFKNP